MRCLHTVSLLGLVLAASAACVDPDLRRGRAALGQGRYAEAITHLERARARGLAPGRVAADLASAHRAAAALHLDAARCDDAAAHLEVAAGLSAPLLADAQALFGCRARQPMDPAAEAAELKGLYALGDRRVEVLRRLFEVSLSRGDAAAALHHGPELEARYAFGVEDRRRVLPLLLEAGDLAEARRQLERISLAAPGDPLEQLKLAQLRAQTGDRDGARQLYGRLTRDYPSNPMIFLRYAAFLKEVGDAEGAAQAVHTANALRGLDLRDQRQLRPLPKSRR